MRRFTIRKYRAEDVDKLYEAIDESREHVGRWMGWMTPEFSRDDARQWVGDSIASWERGDSFEHVIVDSEDGKIAGACGLNFVRNKDLFCNLGYWVRASKLRLGAAREAVLLLKDLGIRGLGLNRLEIVVADGNMPSRRLAESLGACYEGIQRLRLCVGERAYDAHMYALLKK